MKNENSLSETRVMIRLICGHRKGIFHTHCSLAIGAAFSSCKGCSKGCAYICGNSTEWKMTGKKKAPRFENAMHPYDGCFGFCVWKGREQNTRWKGAGCFSEHAKKDGIQQGLPDPAERQMRGGTGIQNPRIPFAENTGVLQHC